MPSFVALGLCALFSAFLFWRDARQHPDASRGLWAPSLWMLIICTRTPTQWLEIFGLPGASGSDTEGTPVDACIFFALILAGAIILSRRQVRLGEVIRNNRCLAFFLIYCFCAIWWADSPFISFKRWIKILGHPIMALVLLTEPDPDESFVRMLKRCAYVFVPFSIMGIKYFPAWGRGFDGWSGLPSNFGVTNNKNTLGCVCMILNLFFIWQFLRIFPREKSRERTWELLLCVIFLLCVTWLLYMAHSSTSLASLVAGVAMMLFLGLRVINLRYLGAYLVFGAVLFVVSNWMFNIVDLIIAALGRDSTLTDRTVIWQEVLKIKINPVLGTGFESFWSGDRQAKLTESFFWVPNQAHNGYLETYLNLGYIGLLAMFLFLLSAFRKGSRTLLSHFDWGRFRVSFLIAFLLYNWTEAAFKALHPAWFIFFVIAMDMPRPEPEEISEHAQMVEPLHDQPAFEGEIVV